MFRGYIAPNELDKPRGGFTISGASPRSTNGEVHVDIHTGLPIECSPDYHQESSFSEEQLPYIRLIVGGLVRSMRGEFLTSATSYDMYKDIPKPEVFSERIIRNFLEQPQIGASFGTAMHHSTLQLLSYFVAAYPNLTPALDAMIRTAGAEGTEIAVMRSRSFLYKALGGQPVDDSVYLQKDASVRRFTRQHPTYSGGQKKYEVRCTGIAVAKEIIWQAGTAAKALTSTPSPGKNYKPNNDSYVAVEKLGIKRRIEDHIRHLYANMRQQQTSTSS